jgi:RNA polymerase sigma-54 factor
VRPSLQVRLSQHLALTPQLQQSIRLLQLSTLELHQEVEQMLEQNPFLEVEGEDGAAADTSGAERSVTADAAAERPSGGVDERPGEATSASTSDSADGGDEPAGVDSQDYSDADAADWDRDNFDSGEASSHSSSAGASMDDDFEPTERSGAGPTLREHLREQLGAMRLSPVDAAAVAMLIESLNDDGYLADSLADLADGLLSPDEQTADDEVAQGVLDANADDGDEVDPDADHPGDDVAARLRCALALLQSMDPTGVGARSLSECLTLQLRARPGCAAQTVAVAIVERHLELLAKRDFKRLGALTGADDDTLRAAQALIVSCEPKPGRPFSRTEAQIVVPDVIVVRAGRGWRATLNPDVMPKLRINDLYAQAIRGQRNGNSAGLSARLQEARWFMKNIQQRFDTILRVSTAILERQKGFFSHGAIAMKPLVLREIADELGLHESTISRVTTAKYMATPYGTFELKYFFGSSLNTEAGGNASSTAVRALIKQLVSAEDAGHPLSDSQLSEMLAEQGIQVARRTVAKYREALRIAPANLRRTL